MTTAAEGSTLAPPKIILCNGHPIRLRFVQQFIWSFLVANAGALVVSALYYLFVQVKWPGATYSGHTHTVLYLKPYWDSLFPWHGWAADRHDVRDVYESVFATLGVKSLLVNWRKIRWQAPAWYVALSPVIILVAAAVPVTLAVFLLDHGFPYLWHMWFSRHVVHNPVHLQGKWSWLGTYLAGYPWQPAVVGIVAGLVVHRVYAPAGDRVQLFFVGRSVDRARDARDAGEANPLRYLPRWPLPPVIRERAWWYMDNSIPVPNRDLNIKAAVYAVSAVVAGLAIYGGYVRYVVAKGH